MEDLLAGLRPDVPAADAEPAPATAPAAASATSLVIRNNLAQVDNALTEFDKINAGLVELNDRFPPDLVYDVRTTKGMSEAVAHRAAWRQPRIAVEKLRKAAKSPVLALGRDIDARAAWLTEQLSAGEAPVDEQIKAEEARKAQERADREAAEFGRVVAMQEAVSDIAMLAMNLVGKPSALLADTLAYLRGLTLDPALYQEMLPQASEARTAAINKLEVAVKAAQWDEAQAAERRADEARRLAEQQAADAERARVAAAQRAEAERLARVEAEQRQAAADLAAQRADLEARLAELAAASKPAAVPTVEAAPASVAPVTALAPPPAVRSETRAVDTRPPITTGTLCKRLGFTVDVQFVRSLGIEPASPPPDVRKGAGTWWSERDYPAIKAAIVRHIQGLPDVLAAVDAREAMAA